MDERRVADMATRVANLGKYKDLAGCAVLEIGADWHNVAAKQLVAGGAKKVVSTNMYEKWVELASQDVLIERQRADARLLHQVFPANSFDVIFGIAVLEHINGIAEFLESARSVLRPGGLLFVHGGPLWTGNKGHHIWVKATDWYRFSDKSNPIKNWNHLVNDRRSLAADLINSGIPADDAEVVAKWTYESDEINRCGYGEMMKFFEKSGLEKVDVVESAFFGPDDDLLRKINAGPWGGQVRYDISGLTFVARR